MSPLKPKDFQAVERHLNDSGFYFVLTGLMVFLLAVQVFVVSKTELLGRCLPHLPLDSLLCVTCYIVALSFAKKVRALVFRAADVPNEKHVTGLLPFRDEIAAGIVGIEIAIFFFWDD